MRDLQTNLVLGPADDLVAGAAEKKERLGCSESNILDMLRVGDSQDSGHDSPHRLEKSRIVLLLLRHFRPESRVNVILAI